MIDTSVKSTENGHGAASASPAGPVVAGEIRRVSPLDLHALSGVAVTSTEAVRAAVGRARSAQVVWAEVGFSDRVRALKRAAKRMLRERADVMALVHTEMGKCDAECVFNEALGPLDSIGGWAKVVESAIGPTAIGLNPMSFPNKRASVELVPRGVVGVIAPWNFPVSGLYRSVFPTLLTGNGLVLKPSEYTPLASAWFVEQLARELPPGLVQVVQGDGAVGAALVEAGIDACVFTGSVKAGRSVRIRCAELGIPSSVEMGGKDAAIVLGDCDLARTVAGLTHWALSNAGQACGAIEIAYVDRTIADELVERLRSAFTRLNTDAGRPGGADVGPLAHARQLAIVEAHVKDALGKGARLVCGGARTGSGYGYVPTLLDGCTERMDVVRDETFGPVLAIVRIDGAEEGVRQVNASRYGLGTSIWTGDLERGQRLAKRLDVGVVTINNHAFTGAIPALPWSGTRDTGFGVANSVHALATFTRPKAVVVDASKASEFFFLPYDKALVELGNLLSDAQIGRIGRAWKLPLLFRARAKRVREFFR